MEVDFFHSCLEEAVSIYEAEAKLIKRVVIVGLEKGN